MGKFKKKHYMINSLWCNLQNTHHFLIEYTYKIDILIYNYIEKILEMIFGSLELNLEEIDVRGIFFVENITSQTQIYGAFESNKSIIGELLLNGKKCIFYCENGENKGICFGYEQEKQIRRALYEARKEQVPIIYFINCCGADLQDGINALDAYASVFYEMSKNSNELIHIAVITGNCVGGAAYLAELCDFVLFSREKGNFCLTGPRIVEKTLGEKSTKKELGGVDIHSKNGTIDIVFESINECREALDYILNLSYHKWQVAKKPVYELKNEILPFNNRPYDINSILCGIVDENSMLELCPSFAANMITCLARINGRNVAIIANQPYILAGAIDVHAAEKGTAFLNKCQKIRLPLLVLVDVPSFMPGREQEQKGIEWKGSQFLKAMIQLDTEKITLVLHKNYGGAYIALNSLKLGAKKVYAWPGSHIGIMGEKTAKVLGKRDDRNIARDRYYLEGGFVTEIIEPEETRKRLAQDFGVI